MGKCAAAVVAAAAALPGDDDDEETRGELERKTGVASRHLGDGQVIYIQESSFSLQHTNSRSFLIPRPCLIT